MMMKLKSKRLSRSISKLGSWNRASATRDETKEDECKSRKMKMMMMNENEIEWEVRPGGMLVQKRHTTNTEEEEEEEEEAFITIRVSTVSHSHHISIQPTSTFGELKMILSLMTSMEPREQRILFKGKERDDDEYLHMVGVRDKDKVLLLQDPAIMEKKNKNLQIRVAAGSAQPIISV